MNTAELNNNPSSELTKFLAVQSSQSNMLQTIIDTLENLPGKVLTGNPLTLPDFRISPMSRNEMKRIMRRQIALKFQAKYC